jgi:nickel-type superoxide dismutase maturation protease
MVIVRRVMGESMLPTLHPNTIIVAIKYRRPRVGDIVVAQHKGRELIKRVSEARQSEMFLLGDNTNGSTDSRHFGRIDQRTIKGVVVWPRTLKKPAS